MTETKKFENERYLYWEADVYTPYSFRKPKLHDYLDVLARIEQWINNQIVICYMENKDRDLSIEIMGNGKGMMAI